jgi:hypothetical protein
LKKPRKKKAAARWAMLEMVPVSELEGSTISAGDPLYRIVVDNRKSKTAVKAGAELGKIEGAVLLVCIHETGAARLETKTLFNWNK